MSINSSAQHYFIFGNYGFTATLWNYDLNSQDCTISQSPCVVNSIGAASTLGHGATMSPDSNLFTSEQLGIYQIDTLTGQWSPYYTFNNINVITGLVCIGNDKFYGVQIHEDSLHEINVASGTVTNLGSTGFPSKSDLTIFNGAIYYATEIGSPPTIKGIVKVDINNPSNSTLVVTIPVTTSFWGLTASNICNTLVAAEAFTNQIIAINLIEGTITPVCDYPDYDYFNNIVSMQEFRTPTCCEIALDLDSDDSSGATDADYNAQDFTCVSSPVRISDTDISILFDTLLTDMTIQLTGVLPDVPNEMLLMTGSVPGIDVSGSGTGMITLSNAGGAKSADFKDALRLIRYDNTALYPTGGLRTVEVQFETESGAVSNIATAIIQVNEIPLITIDLGPDLEKCEGETATFNAGNPGAIYHWSTGQTSQSITVNNSGQYIVGVINGINCPNQDTVELSIIPVITVSLTGDTEICDNEQANLTINTDAPFSLTVEVTPNPGSPFTFTDVTSDYNFFDLPGVVTEYTITSVIPSQPACIDLTDSTQVIFVYPTYIQSMDVSLCEGDSIWLGYYWENEPGVYEILFDSEYGCDSTVTFTINALPAVSIAASATTCNPAEAGVFISHIDNPSGCDTILTTTVSLLLSDTTQVSLSSCNLSSTGVFSQLLTNQEGCDSVIITTVSLIPPADTTSLFQTTCDSSLLGVYEQRLVDGAGCDSIIIITIAIAPTDTSFLNATSCDSASIGVFQSLFSNQTGCDSLVITTVSAGMPDTTYFNTTSCDSASLGVFETHFNSQAGCDSTVIITIAYSDSDHTFLSGSSCDVSEAGVFVDSLINRFGCDSIVTTTVTLSISDNIFINASTCDPGEAGVFVLTFVNQFGCDSVVTETIDLLASDETFLFSTTCMSSLVGTFITTHFNQYGCDSSVTLTVSLVPADTTILSFKTCDLSQVGNIENSFTNQDGCDSFVIEQTSLYPLPDLQMEITSDFNGFDISCFGESDGSANANVSGVPPFSYIWSTGGTNQSLTGLMAGDYTVTITDGNGCKTHGIVTLADPDPFSISFEVSQPNCFDQQNGSITVQQSGGVSPIRYSIDGLNYQPSASFTGLGGGTYEIIALDANDCEKKEIIWINVPLMVNVELGDDQIITPGDTTIIHAIVNVPFDSLASVTWSGLTNPDCPTCLVQAVVPIITTTYSVSVTSIDGCKDEDALTLFLERKIDVYVPSLFSPNGDNINDRLLISAGPDVEEISSFVVYDRWGNMVFSAEHFLPNDPTNAWDGTLKGRSLNSAVFAFKLIAKFRDGRSEARYGDVTLIK